ncbi:MAG: hypothetical protein QXJ17_05490 [Nitrososphaeria archaeon]
MLSRKNGTRIMVVVLVILVASTSFTTFLYLDYRSKYESLNENYGVLQSRYEIMQRNYSSIKEDFKSVIEEYSALRSSYDALQASHITLQDGYDRLRSDYSNLSTQYNRLQDSYSNLTLHYDQLVIQYNELQHKFDSLATSHKNLESNYADLSAQYAVIEHDLSTWKQLHIGTTLETYYDHVRANVLTIGGYPLGEERWWLFPDYYEISVNLAAEMAAHDAGNLYWPNLESESEYYSYVGEYSYQTANRILSRALALANVTYTDNTIIRIDKIMKFTSSIVHYESRLIDHMWFPTETLTFRSGDCTSFSIIGAALFEMVGIKSAIGFFKNSEGEGHAMILIHLDDLEEYRYYYYPDLSSLGLSKGKWIIIEPQFNSLYE